MIKKMTMIVLLAAFAGTGCTKDDGAVTPASDPKPKTEATAKTAVVAKEEKGHAPSDVKPGSHEDWCDEHGVPESQCTRCNGELIAAFKATGDWCDEHGLPESQCLKCNPELKIVRPPKETN